MPPARWVPSPLAGPRPARPFPGLATPHARVPAALLTHLQLARTRRPHISGTRRRGGSERRRSARPARRRTKRAGAALGGPGAAVRLETGSREPEGRSSPGRGPRLSSGSRRSGRSAAPAAAPPAPPALGVGDSTGAERGAFSMSPRSVGWGNLVALTLGLKARLETGSPTWKALGAPLSPQRGRPASHPRQVPSALRALSPGGGGAGFVA